MSTQLHIEFSSDFVEEAVFFVVHELEEQGRQGELAERFHRERSRFYEAAGSMEQNGFGKFYADFFEELGLKLFFYAVAAGFPKFVDGSIRFLIRRSYGRKSEGAELFVRGSSQTIITALQVTRVLDLNFLSGYLRHEWMRVSDMLDPLFQYDAHADLKGSNEIEENLNRDRFKILWDLSIASRLSKAGHSSFLNAGELKNRFERTFDAWLSTERANIYGTVVSSWPLSQRSLIDFSVAGNQTRTSSLAPVHCPLCYFTSYKLLRDFENTQVVDVCSMVRKDYPKWSPEDGMCAQCFELYRSRQKVGCKP